MVAAGWLVLIPLMIVVGPALLGSVGDEAKAPLTVLLIAFAIDGFYFVLYQIYLRIHPSRALRARRDGSGAPATMVGVTILLQGDGSAPAYGQLAARVVVCAVIVTPLLLARLGRLDWFRGIGLRDRMTAGHGFSVSVVIAVYNGAATVGEVVERGREVLAPLVAAYEFVLVNDGSADASWARIEEPLRRRLAPDVQFDSSVATTPAQCALSRHSRGPP